MSVRAKQKRLSEFDIDPMDDFISNNRKQFGHICDNCTKVFRCDKAKNSIILNCNNYKQYIKRR